MTGAMTLTRPPTHSYLRPKRTQLGLMRLRAYCKDTCRYMCARPLLHKHVHQDMHMRIQIQMHNICTCTYTAGCILCTQERINTHGTYMRACCMHTLYIHSGIRAYILSEISRWLHCPLVWGPLKQVPPIYPLYTLYKLGPIHHDRDHIKGP